MTTPSPGTENGTYAALRMMAVAFLGAIVAIGAATAVIIPLETWFDAPAALSLIVTLLVGVAAVGGMLTVGHNVPAVPASASTEAATAQGVTAFRTSFMVRLAFGEVPALVGLAMSVADENGSAVPFLIDAAISLVLLGLYAYPSVTSVRRIERKLNREGGHAQLVRAFGLDGGAASGYTGGGTVL